MSKLARKYLRALKVWGIGPEQAMTRKEQTRAEIYRKQLRKRSERKNG